MAGSSKFSPKKLHLADLPEQNHSLAGRGTPSKAKALIGHTPAAAVQVALSNSERPQCTTWDKLSEQCAWPRPRTCSAQRASRSPKKYKHILLQDVKWCLSTKKSLLLPVSNLLGRQCVVEEFCFIFTLHRLEQWTSSIYVVFCISSLYFNIVQ